MKDKSLLRSFERCLKSKNLESMTKDLYEFFNQRCGFIAHYDIHGFRDAYQEPEEFLEFYEYLQEELEGDIKSAKWDSDFTDNTDSFKYGYEFNIPKLKQQMLDLLNKNATTITEICNMKILENLREERELLDKKIAGYETPTKS